MKISIQKEISETYPKYMMGLIKIETKDKNLEKLQTLTKYEKSVIEKELVKKEWLDVFASMNASERRLPSIIALWNIIDNFGELKSINYFVNAYNYISIKHGIPMGGYDIKKLPHQELTLKHAVQGGVKFEPMGLSGQLEKLKDPAEICYYCGDIPVCRYWNNKDSEITKIYDNTDDVLIMFDTLGTIEALNNAIDDFVEILKSTSDITDIKIEILTKDKLSCEI